MSEFKATAELKLLSPALKAADTCGRVVHSPQFARAILILVLASEAAALLILASRKPFWYDELLTFHVSTLQPFPFVLQALHEGVDGMPPGYYVMVRLAKVLSGDPHIILRLPSIFGYMLTLLGVYWFARRRSPALASLAAVLLITLSPFRQFAIEARSYSLLTGLLAISAALWQRIDEKPFIKPLFALFLALAVSCHYYAVLTIALFGVAELTRTLLSARIRWGVWAACLVATSPFFWELPILVHYREVFGKTFWSQPTWSTVFTTFPDYLGIDFNFDLVLMLFFAMVLGESLLRTLWTRREGYSERDFSPSEISLVSGFLFYPALLVILTKVLAGGYHSRYGWPVIFGLALALVYLLRTVALQRSMYLIVTLLMIFFYQDFHDCRRLATTSTSVDERWAKLDQLSQAEIGIPVVIASGVRFLEAVHYSPPDLRQRLVEVFDANMANDTSAKTNRLLTKFVPLPIEDLSLFRAEHPKFFLRSGGYDWFTQYLLNEKYRLTFLSLGTDAGGPQLPSEAWSLYLVEQQR